MKILQNSSPNTAKPKKPSIPLAKYCTQKYLLGLKNNLPMDNKCSNYTVHTNSSLNDLHAIKYGDLTSLFHEQTNNNIESIEPINSKYGTVGYMTKITIYPYGYTIIGKSKPSIYENNNVAMKHKKFVYKHLYDLQGFVDVGYYCYILLSYGGENPEPYEDFNHETVWKIEERLRDRGVRQNDVRLENIVLSKELGHEMLVDLHVLYCQELDEDTSDENYGY